MEVKDGVRVWLIFGVGGVRKERCHVVGLGLCAKKVGAVWDPLILGMVLGNRDSDRR